MILHHSPIDEIIKSHRNIWTPTYNLLGIIIKQRNELGYFFPTCAAPLNVVWAGHHMVMVGVVSKV
jgi:hypothetical protein